MNRGSLYIYLVESIFLLIIQASGYSRRLLQEKRKLDISSYKMSVSFIFNECFGHILYLLVNPIVAVKLTLPVSHYISI